MKRMPFSMNSSHLSSLVVLLSLVLLCSIGCSSVASNRAQTDSLKSKRPHKEQKVPAKAGISEKNAKLIQAAEKGNFSGVQTALTAGSDINATEDVKIVGSVTALWMASKNGHTEVVKLLLDKGADVNVKVTMNGDGWTALKIAKKRGQTDIVGVLERAGAKE